MISLGHHMLLDAKKVEDLGIGDYLWNARMATTGEEVEKIYRDLMEDLASCDVSNLYEEKERSNEM